MLALLQAHRDSVAAAVPEAAPKSTPRQRTRVEPIAEVAAAALHPGQGAERFPGPVEQSADRAVVVLVTLKNP